MVNNAGVALGTPPAHENPIADVETMLRTNVSSVMAFVSTFAPGMVERNEGHIVNISSIAGHEAYPGGSVYCATKHAIDAYTTSMRHDLVGTNIRVTAISPVSPSPPPPFGACAIAHARTCSPPRHQPERMKWADSFLSLSLSLCDRQNVLYCFV